MKNVYIFAILTFPILTFGQVDSVTQSVSYWKLKSILGLNGTQSSYVNWNAGGRNNVSVIGFVSAQANYLKNNFKCDNDMSLALGGLQYTGENLQGSEKNFQKTDDRIELSSNTGLRIRKSMYFSMISSFRTQFLDGFALPNDSVRVSTFMAPGYLNIGLGLEYSPNDNFALFVSPLSSKMTFVKSAQLANSGAFGVEAATYDAIGNLVTPGKQFRGEFGAFLKMKYNKNVAKNIDVKTKLELFSNYLKNPENIDVNAEVSWYFKVNNWLSASLQWLLVYDDDIRSNTPTGLGGPKVQFKSVLGIGLSYTLKNFKE